MGYVATARKFVSDNYPIESAMNIDEVIEEVLDDEEYGEEEFAKKEIEQRFLDDVDRIEQQLEMAASIGEIQEVMDEIRSTIKSYKMNKTEYHVPLEVLIGLFRLRGEAEDKLEQEMGKED